MTTLFRVFVAVALGAVLVVVLMLNYGLMDQIQTLPVATLAQSQGVDQLWFHDRSLIGVKKQDAGLSVTVWSSSDGHEERKHLLPAHGPSTVAPDASAAAWFSGGGVHVRALTGPKAGTERTVPLPGKAVSGLAFTELAGLAALFGNGELVMLNPETGSALVSTKVNLADGVLSASGTYLTVAVPSRGEAYTYDTRAADRISFVEYRKTPLPFQTMTLSPGGRLVFGTQDGAYYSERPLGAPGRVRAITVVDNERVFAAGDFAGIYFLLPGEKPYQIAPAEAGKVSLLAANGTHLAAIGPGGVSLLSHHLRKVWLPKSDFMLPRWVLFTLFALLGLITGLFALQLFGGSKREKEEEDLQLPQPVPPEELVEACKEGRAVLYAGSGLSAQSGFRPWGRFTPLLVDWAEDRHLVSESLAEKMKTSLLNGETRMMDRLAGALSNSQPQLLEHLRQVYLQSAYARPTSSHRELSQIPFAASVTTNFDRLLEMTFPQFEGRVFTPADAETAANSLKANSFFVFKNYGTLDDPTSFHIGPKQHRAELAGAPATRALFREIASSKSLFFVGASMEGLDAEFGQLGLHKGDHKHYALVAVTSRKWKSQASRLYHRYGIQVLPYTAHSDNHDEMVNFIHTLASQVVQPAVATAVARAS